MSHSNCNPTLKLRADLSQWEFERLRKLFGLLAWRSCKASHTPVCLLPAGDCKAHPVGSQRDLSADVFSRRRCAYDHNRQSPEGHIVSIAVAVDDSPWKLLSTRKLRSPHIAVVPIADDHRIKVLRWCS